MPKAKMHNWQVGIRTDTGWERTLQVQAPDFGAIVQIVEGWAIRGLLLVPEKTDKLFTFLPPHKIAAFVLNPTPTILVVEGEEEETDE